MSPLKATLFLYEIFLHQRTVMRLFIAIDMPDDVKEEVTRIQQELQKQTVFKARYTKPDDAHITVSFLGELEEKRVYEAADLLRGIYMQPMEARLSSLNVFSVGSSLKVIYCDVQCPELAVLLTAIKRALANMLMPQEQEFIGHITLARVAQVDDNKKAQDYIQHITVKPIPFIIDSFVLKQSELAPEGPLYTTIEQFMLG